MKQQRDITEKSVDEVLVEIYRKVNSINTICTVFLVLALIGLLIGLHIL